MHHYYEEIFIFTEIKSIFFTNILISFSFLIKKISCHKYFVILSFEFYQIFLKLNLLILFISPRFKF